MTSNVHTRSNRATAYETKNVRNGCQSKFQSSVFCELRYRDRSSTEIAISGDSYVLGRSDSPYMGG
eukprot:948082-Pleurochrysis_carterae.AAC.1